MATIIHPSEYQFEPNANKIDGFRLQTNVCRERLGINPKYLNFDVRKLVSNQFNAPYHFHRYADELFYIISGSAKLRTPNRIETVSSGDILYFEAGASGAHQLFNDTDTDCIYLDMRSYIGHDICEYPDSDKIIIVPNGETFASSEQKPYFDGENGPYSIWNNLVKKTQ
ncbi:MAG: cupin domain-containing protein [Paludibacter sp.]|nr:cupin domain-containing protein [Bacteroidales bacterium]MCM1069218.1 cupin domain-containing protein [Prevotella sp.]MCM1354362.1 cupin domain-containing protein [Bacteroides sp.]MCM1443178.1 cupin domain-containing protein [Muribaculum sp.]MCM1481773.1 cupin domain-containing protein [Paludibacter sp.]